MAHLPLTWRDGGEVAPSTSSLPLSCVELCEDNDQKLILEASGPCLAIVAAASSQEFSLSPRLSTDLCLHRPPARDKREALKAQASPRCTELPQVHRAPPAAFSLVLSVGMVEDPLMLEDVLQQERLEGIDHEGANGCIQYVTGKELQPMEGHPWTLRCSQDSLSFSKKKGTTNKSTRGGHPSFPPEAVKGESWTGVMGQQVHHHLAQLPKGQPRARLHRGSQPLHSTAATTGLCPVTVDPAGTTNTKEHLNIPPGTQLVMNFQGCSVMWIMVGEDL
nr:uncharacterized protein LOC129019161 [Pongo pygmaeus]